jgi:hypothetical protein
MKKQQRETTPDARPPMVDARLRRVIPPALEYAADAVHRIDREISAKIDEIGKIDREYPGALLRVFELTVMRLAMQDEAEARLVKAVNDLYAAGREQGYVQ